MFAAESTRAAILSLGSSDRRVLVAALSRDVSDPTFRLLCDAWVDDVLAAERDEAEMLEELERNFYGARSWPEERPGE